MFATEKWNVKIDENYFKILRCCFFFFQKTLPRHLGDLWRKLWEKYVMKVHDGEGEVLLLRRAGVSNLGLVRTVRISGAKWQICHNIIYMGLFQLNTALWQRRCLRITLRRVQVRQVCAAPVRSDLEDQWTISPLPLILLKHPRCSNHCEKADDLESK